MYGVVCLWLRQNVLRRNGAAPKTSCAKTVTPKRRRLTVLLRAGVEPTTLRLRVIASTNAPPCPTDDYIVVHCNTIYYTRECIFYSHTLYIIMYVSMHADFCIYAWFVYRYECTLYVPCV